MEALCDLKSTEPDSSTAACLSALLALLHSSRARGTLAAQPPLAVEVCNVLHRVVLTKTARIQQLAFEVLLTLIQAAQEDLNRSSSEDDLHVGEGGSEGELLPGTSLVFAALEVCLCLLVQVYPNIDPNGGGSSIRKSPTSAALSGKAGQDLVASALDVMGLLPSVCSPQGALSLLPALLHLTTNVLKEAGTLESPAAQAGLRSLRSFCNHPYSRLGETEAAYGKLIQSCAARLLDWGKVGQDDRERLDPLVLLSAVTEMLLHAQPTLLSCPELLYPSLNAFQQSLQSPDSLQKLHTIRLFGKLVQDVSQRLSNDSSAERKTILRPLTPYVHALAPKIVTGLCGPSMRQLDSQQQLIIIIESINCIEALVSLTEPENCKLIFKHIYLTLI